VDREEDEEEGMGIEEGLPAGEEGVEKIDPRGRWE